jgi:hypothetical protein
MRGAINLAQAIDSDVEIVETFEGGRADMAYLKLEGEWEARIIQTSHQRLSNADD